MDNDRDGLADLEDPECLSPCDDDEEAYAFNQPQGLLGCNVDCAFDGNDGVGDDGCPLHLRCDPADWEWAGCTYNPEPPCNEELDEGCVEFCGPLTPNGCDCWGCCSLTVDGQPRNVQILHPFCGPSNLEACPGCTQRIDICGNACDRIGCEVCFGETAPAAECPSVSCEPGSVACTSHCECTDGGYCFQGCCHPAPPG